MFAKLRPHLIMAEIKKPSLVKPIVGAIFSSEGILIKAKVNLEKKFGPLDFESSIVPFNSTKYYEKEMGPGLLRQFLSFQRLINPQDLAAIKLYTNRLEKRLSCRQDRFSRKINLDPGYICASKLVLATCKNYSHRIYLDKGVFAEVSLHFRQGTFIPWPWTYPDYKTSEYVRCFNAIREIYLKQLPR